MTYIADPALTLETSHSSRGDSQSKFVLAVVASWVSVSVHVETALDAKITFLVAAAQCCFTYDVTTCFYRAPKRGPVLLCPTQSASHKLGRKLDLWVCRRKSFLNARTSQNILFWRTGLLCLIQYPPPLLQIQKASPWGRLSTAAACPARGCPANSICPGPRN